jgi:membrane associated rhomboid family serine protease
MLLFSTYCRICRTSNALLLAVFSASIVSITVVLKSDYQVYGGLSGISCAICAALIAERIRLNYRDMSTYLMLLGLAFYLLLSRNFSSGVNVVREAHTAGALAGIAFALMKRTAKPVFWIGGNE